MITTLLQSKLHTGFKRAGIYKMLCLLMFSLGLTSTLRAQTIVTIPNPYENTAPESNGGLITNTRQPLTNYEKFERSAAIYTSAEIGQSGTITAIAYEVKSVNNPQPVTARVYLKTISTSTTSFVTGATVPGEIAGATLVFDGVVNATSTGWITINLTNPFPYTTANNLEVIVETYNNNGSVGVDNFQDAKLFTFNDNLTDAFLYETESPTANPPLFRAITSFRPNIQLTITGGVTPTCTAPTTVSGNGFRNGTAQLTFSGGDANTNTNELQYSTDATFTSGVVSVNPATSPTNLSGLAPGTYSFRVRTTCTNNVISGFSPVDTFIIAQPVVPQTCDAPTAASVATTGSGTGPNAVQVSYTPSSTGASGTYFITYTRTAPTAGSPVTTQLTSNPFTLSGLDAGATYSYTIFKDCDGTPDGTGTISTNNPGGSFTTQTAPVVCDAPTAASPSTSNVTQTTATVNFTPVAGQTAYQITYSPAGTQTQPVTNTGNSFNLTGLTAGTLYNYEIRTICSGTPSTNALSGSFTTQSAPTPVCEAPTNVSVSSPSANTISVSFTASGGLSGNYFINYGGTIVQLTTSPQTITSVPAGTYAYNVYKDCSGTQVSGGSGSVTVNDPSPNPVCEAPTNVSVTSPSANTLTVSYTASSGLSGDYFLEYGATTVQLTSNPQTITSVPAGTYNFTVYKMCGTTRVNGTPTGTVTVNDPSPNPVCEAPTNVSVTSPSANTLTVSYTASSGLAGDYFLEYGTTTVQLTSNPQTITSVPAGTYNFTVYKMCGTTRVNGTPTGSVTVNNPAQPCNPPTAGTAVSNNFNELTVSYTASSTGASGNYFIAYTPTGGGTTTTVALTSNPQTITSVPAGTYNFTIYKDCSGVQSAGNPTGTVTVQDAPLPTVCTTGTWLGTTSTDWHTAANWCNGIIPDGSTNVIIPANTGSNPVPNYPVVSLNALANNLTIQTNATLTLSSGLLTVNGLYTNLGTLIDNGNGSMVFTSPIPQTLGKPGQTLTFLDLTTGPGGIIQGGPVRVRRVLTLNGNMTTLGNELTLLADNAIQSMVVNNGSAVVIGTATMEKYINPGNNPSFGYRHLASPVANATISQLNDDTPLIVNPAYNTNPTPGTTVPFPNIYRYNETRLDLPLFTAPNFDTGWESPNDLNEVMPPAVGYTVNMLPVEIDFTGTLNNGPYTRPLTRGSQPRSGYNFLGNPYPAPINWDLVTLPPNMDRAAYVVRSTGQYTGTYVAYVNGIPANGEFIAAMQGFFVRLSTPNSTASITFENDDRVTTYENPALYKKAETRPVITLALRDATGVEGKTYVYFEAGATVNFDGNYDAFKMPHTGPVPSIFSRAGNDQLAINGLPLSATNTIIPLGGKVPQAGTWTIAADQIINFLPGQTIYLEDIATNTMHNLGQQNSYTFTTTQTDLSGRFFLRFGPGAVSGITPDELAAKVQVYPNPNHGQFTISMPALNASVVEAAIYNAVGQKVWSKALQTDGLYLKETITTQKLAPGVYSLRLETNAGPVQRKIIIE